MQTRESWGWLQVAKSQLLAPVPAASLEDRGHETEESPRGP